MYRPRFVTHAACAEVISITCLRERRDIGETLIDITVLVSVIIKYERQRDYYVENGSYVKKKKKKTLESSSVTRQYQQACPLICFCISWVLIH